jgi:hypothetical protein
MHCWDRVPRSLDRTSLSQIADSPRLESQVPVFISSMNRVAQFYAQALRSILLASRLAGLTNCGLSTTREATSCAATR